MYHEGHEETRGRNQAKSHSTTNKLRLKYLSPQWTQRAQSNQQELSLRPLRSLR